MQVDAFPIQRFAASIRLSTCVPFRGLLIGPFSDRDDPRHDQNLVRLTSRLGRLLFESCNVSFTVFQRRAAVNITQLYVCPNESAVLPRVPEAAGNLSECFCSPNACHDPEISFRQSPSEVQTELHFLLVRISQSPIALAIPRRCIELLTRLIDASTLDRSA